MSWHLHLDALLWVLLLEGAYLVAVGPLRRRFGWADRIEPSKVSLFSLGVFTIFLAEATPIHDLSERYLFSVHMVQHMLLIMVMAPLLLLGTPGWLLRPLLRPPLAMRLARLLTHPVVAFGLINAVLLAWHLPEAYDLTLRNHTVHIVEHLTFMASAVLMWWPILSPLPELPPLNYLGQFVYLFLQSFVPAVLGGVITFSGGVIYQFYAEAPRVWHISALTDQQIGGLIMKVAGTLILWLILTIIFFVWFHREESRDRPEARVPSQPLSQDYAGRAIRDWEVEIQKGLRT